MNTTTQNYQRLRNYWNRVKRRKSSRGNPGCKRMSTKKYATRPSPPYPANECGGMKKRGNNGRMWISTQDVTGVFRWKQM